MYGRQHGLVAVGRDYTVETAGVGEPQLGDSNPIASDFFVSKRRWFHTRSGTTNPERPILIDLGRAPAYLRPTLT